MAIRKPQRKSNRQLWIMLALIVVIVAVIALLPSGEESATDRQQEDRELAETTLVKAGDTAPDFTVEMVDGSTVTLSELRGKVGLLNFWATWCPPCREELTHVQTEIIDRFAGEPFLFLPVSRGESRQAVETFRQKSGHDFPMGLDSTESIYRKYASNFIPRNFLIDADGKVVSATVGYEPDEFEELIRTIQATLAKLPAEAPAE